MVKGRFISVNPQRALWVGVAALLMWGAAGCSTYSNYPAGMEATIRGPLREGKKTQYQKHFGQRIEGGKEEVLFSMELGRVAQLEGDIEMSKTGFESAVQDIQEQEDKAKISASGAAAQTGAVLVNDKTIPYRAADFEKTLVHHYQALNYLEAQDLEGAAVEVRLANETQKMAMNRYRSTVEKAESKEKNVSPDDERDPYLVSVYAGLDEIAGAVKVSFQNAATYYVSSVVWEMRGEPNDAYIDIKRALEIYPNNRFLQEDVVRLGKRLGMREDLDDFARRFPKTADTPAAGSGRFKGKARLVVLLEEGFVPVKSEMSIAYPLFGAGSIGAIALPMYAQAAPPAVPLVVSVGGKSMGQTVPICNVGALAARALEERMPGIMTRQIARAVAKGAAAYAADNAGGGLASLAVMLYNIVSEQADLRSWLTLPAHIQIWNAWVEPGTPTVTLGGSLWSEEVTLNADKTTFIYVSKIDLTVYSHILVQP
jgi:uncharacterized protein